MGRVEPYEDETLWKAERNYLCRVNSESQKLPVFRQNIVKNLALLLGSGIAVAGEWLGNGWCFPFGYGVVQHTAIGKSF